MEPHRQQTWKVGGVGEEATSQGRVKAGHAVAGMETATYQELVLLYRKVFATGTPRHAPSSPPTLTPEEEAIARRFLAEGGGEAKTRLHKKMQSGF
ncbi:hypothetical protein [Aquabacter sediminis]|uniref:hypothetical protein n=1 Tax=Aquabacter sediminis TaxID=3029197 RepID=UPI00237EDB15|nr:hypothetical protein [Aquabacter sp. P-9]MDE1570389.1 hypothetical protein [Aquabacter sp. P-9]